MNARCTGCDAHLDFKATRGARLAAVRCGCGCRYEPMYYVRVERDPKDRNRTVEVHRTYNAREYFLHPDERRYVPLVPTASP